MQKSREEYSGQQRIIPDWQINYRTLQCRAIFDYKVVTFDEKTVTMNGKHTVLGIVFPEVRLFDARLVTYITNIAATIQRSYACSRSESR